MRSAAQDLTTPAGWGSTAFSPKIEKPKRRDSLLDIDPRHLRWVPGLIERRNCHESGFASLFPKRSPGGSVAAEVLLSDVRKRQQVTTSSISATGYDRLPDYGPSPSAAALVSPRYRGHHLSARLEPLPGSGEVDQERGSRLTASDRSMHTGSHRDSAPQSARLSGSRVPSSSSHQSKLTGLSSGVIESGALSPKKRPPLERLCEELGLPKAENQQPSVANGQKVRNQWLASKEPTKPSAAVYKKRAWHKKKDIVAEMEELGLGPMAPEVLHALQQQS